MFEPLVGSGESQVNGGHNFVMLCIMVILSVWVSRVTRSIFHALDIKSRLETAPCLVLEFFSVFAEGFQMLIRNHFNQILRMRRTVPPDALPKQRMLVHLSTEGISLHRVKGKLRLKFQVQSYDRSRIICNLHWGLPPWSYDEMLFGQQPHESGAPKNADLVSAKSSSSASEFRSLSSAGAKTLGKDPRTGAPSLDTSKCDESVEIRLPVPVEVADTPGFFTQCDVELEISQTALAKSIDMLSIPLCIVLDSQSPADGITQQYSFCKISLGDDKISIEVCQQVFPIGSSFQEVQGIYGFEDVSERDCMICYDIPKNVMLLPCRHCSVCAICLRSLRDEKCPLCRSSFTSYVIFPPHMPTEDKRPSTRAAREPYLQRIRTQPRQTSRASTSVRVSAESADQAEPLLSSRQNDDRASAFD